MRRRLRKRESLSQRDGICARRDDGVFDFAMFSSGCTISALDAKEYILVDVINGRRERQDQRASHRPLPACLHIPERWMDFFPTTTCFGIPRFSEFPMSAGVEKRFGVRVCVSMCVDTRHTGERQKTAKDCKRLQKTESMRTNNEISMRVSSTSTGGSGPAGTPPVQDGSAPSDPSSSAPSPLSSLRCVSAFRYVCAMRSWDYLLGLCVVLVAVVLETVPIPPTERFLPESVGSSKNPLFSYPLVSEQIPIHLLVGITILIAIFGIGLAIVLHVFARNFKHLSRSVKMIDIHDTIFVFVFGIACTVAVTDACKIAIGYQRPNFYEYCAKLGGSPCRDAHKSFPSGHASISFCVSWLLSLVLFSKLRVFRGTVRPWKILLCLSPLCISVYISITRLVDYFHFPIDVVCGGLIGIGVASVFFLTLFFIPTHSHCALSRLAWNYLQIVSTVEGSNLHEPGTCTPDSDTEDSQPFRDSSNHHVPRIRSSHLIEP